MLPVIAIIGRPNVGKSTLFNCITKSRAALVADYAGLTRDRQYGEGQMGNKPYIVIDTGGLTDGAEGVEQLMAQQVWQAMSEADAILFVVDAKSGLAVADEELAQKLRQLEKPVYLVVNKTDGADPDTVLVDFYELSLGQPYAIAATHGRGITTLVNDVLEAFPVSTVESEQPQGIKIAFVGRPNVGKSTLINRILGEERAVVHDKAGTTRDSIFIPFTRRDTDYVLIDTAGIRRRGKVKEVIEKFSIVKALQAIDAANVVVLVIDAHEGVADQDLRLLGFVLEAGRALVIAVNKWDGIDIAQREYVKSELSRKLTFIDFAAIHFISALHGTGVGNIFTSINKAFASATKKLATPQLTKILQDAVSAHEPPLAHGRRIKLKYAHAGGSNPPLIVIHGVQTDAVPASYKKYLEKTFRKVLKLTGTPIRIEFVTSKNPYAGRRNILTPRQIHKRQRLQKYTKGKKK